MNRHDNLPHLVAEIRDSLQVHSISPHFTTPLAHLTSVAQKIVSNATQLPVVLWNIAPSDHFGLLHAIYFEKLKCLASLGFNCVVLIYDAYARDHMAANTKISNEIRNNGINLGKEMLKREIREDKVEFILESDLRYGYNLDEILRFFLSISEVYREIDAESHITDQLYKLLELYYEHIINADIVLAGERDANEVWGGLRNGARLRSLLPDYTPPVVLAFPTLVGTDNVPLSSSKAENTLSNLLTNSQLSDKILSCSEVFLRQFYDYLYFRTEVGRRFDYSIGIRDYESIKRANTQMEDARQRAVAFAIDYFGHR